jgi:prepilin-type N-terminal cleavage/methylation domain-containing protein
MLPRTRPGFTLIELLTVIAIIGVLAAVLIPAAMGVQKRAKVANSQTALAGWASGFVRYKQAYGFFPNLAASATYPSTDTCYLLESGTGAANLGARVIMCLSGRNPNGTLLTAGGTGNRARWNRNAETFVEFSREDYEDFTKLPASTDTTGSIGTGNFLIDRLGNRNIRVVLDFNGSGTITSAAGAPNSSGIPSDIRNMTGTTGIPARVIVYTSASDVTAVDVPTAAVGTRRDDYADVISVQ